MDFILIHKFLKELYKPELKQMQHKRKHRFGPSHFQTRSAGWDSAAIQATLWKWKTYSQGRIKSPEDKAKSPGEILRSQIVILSSHQGTGENGLGHGFQNCYGSRRTAVCLPFPPLHLSKENIYLIPVLIS